jgi:SAM-dependent methyltransferase
MAGAEMRMLDPQNRVNAYFRQEANYWAEIYQRDGVAEAVHQQRLRATLAFVDGLKLGRQAKVLDAGCGAGMATLGLARRGFSVEAFDAVETMAAGTRRRADQAGLGARVSTRVADIHAIPFADGAFDLVVSLGVLPWLPQIAPPLREMVRVLAPGGRLIVSMDARWQLRHLFDPMLSPLTARPRGCWRRKALRSAKGFRSALDPSPCSGASSCRPRSASRSTPGSRGSPTAGRRSCVRAARNISPFPKSRAPTATPESRRPFRQQGNS